MLLLLLHTKVASSAALQLVRPQLHHPTECARPNRPYRIYTGDLRCGSPLERLRTRYKSSQCSREAAQLRTVAAGVSLRVVARCGARRSAMATMHVRGRKAESTQQRYVNRLIRLRVHVSRPNILEYGGTGISPGHS